MSERRELVRMGEPPPRTPLPGVRAFADSLPWMWEALPFAGIAAGAALGALRGRGVLWTVVGMGSGLVLGYLGSLLIGRYRRNRVRAAMRSTRRVGALGFVEWRTSRGISRPHLMITDGPGSPVRWSVPLLPAAELPTRVEPIRLYGGLRRGHWGVPIHRNRPLWPVGPVRHRPLWTSEQALGPLPGLPADVPRPRHPDLLPDLDWRPVRLSFKRTANQVAVVAYELYTGRVLESGFLPPGISHGRPTEQNGLYALCPDRRSLLYGTGWSAIAVFADGRVSAVPVRAPGFAR